MLDTKSCHKCGQNIESDQRFARLKNPTLGEIGYIYFHQRGRGDCYWQYLRDTVIKADQILRPGSWQFT